MLSRPTSISDWLLEEDLHRVQRPTSWSFLTLHPRLSNPYGESPCHLLLSVPIYIYTREVLQSTSSREPASGNFSDTNHASLRMLELPPCRGALPKPDEPSGGALAYDSWLALEGQGFPYSKSAEHLSTNRERRLGFRMLGFRVVGCQGAGCMNPMFSVGV